MSDGIVFSPISMREAVDLIVDDDDQTVYMMVKMSTDMTVLDLYAADGFLLAKKAEKPNVLTKEQAEALDELAAEIAKMEIPDPKPEPEPDPEPSPVPEKNYGRELPSEEEAEQAQPDPADKRKAKHQRIINWFMYGRTVDWIAQELGIKKQTVIYHLHKEGLV